MSSGRDHPGPRARLDRHVADRHPPLHREARGRPAPRTRSRARPAADADPADRAEDRVLGGDAERQLARRSATRIVFGRRCGSVCVASTCSTSDVPIPNASAPNAPCVEVWLSPQTIVIPGCVTPSSGPITWTIPSRPLPVAYSGTPNSSQFARSASSCARASGSVTGPSTVGTLWSIVASDRSGRRTAPAGEPQALERLRRGDLVDQVQVDVQERRPVGLLADDVRVPDPLEQRRATAQSSHARARDRSRTPSAGASARGPRRAPPRICSSSGWPASTAWKQ